MPDPTMRTVARRERWQLIGKVQEFDTSSVADLTVRWNDALPGDVAVLAYGSRNMSVSTDWDGWTRPGFDSFGDEYIGLAARIADGRWGRSQTFSFADLGTNESYQMVAAVFRPGKSVSGLYGTGGCFHNKVDAILIPEGALSVVWIFQTSTTIADALPDGRFKQIARLVQLTDLNYARLYWHVPDHDYRPDLTMPGAFTSTSGTRGVLTVVAA